MARSAYKLIDINRRFKILAKKDLVLDLGAAPGSWLQVARKMAGSEGFILGIDIEPVSEKLVKTPNLAFIQKDIYDADLFDVIKRAASARKFDVVLSDAAPNTTGQKDIDEWRSHELSLRVFDVVKNETKKGGHAVVKVFEGPDTPEIIKLAKESFKEVHLVKPEASTKNSKEAYIVAKNYRK